MRQYLANSGDTLLENTSRQLDDLRYLRILADYEMNDRKVEIAEIAANRVQLAKRLNSNLKSVLNGPDRAKVLTAIANYRKKINDV